MAAYEEVMLKEIVNPFIHFVDSRNHWVSLVVNNILYMEESDDVFDIKFVDGSTYRLELGTENEQNVKSINRLMGFPMGSNVYR